MAQANLTTADALGKAQSIDYVARFTKNIQELLDALGVTRRYPLTADRIIQTYKWDVTKADTKIGEGEDVPLSKVERTPDKTYQVEYVKLAKATSVEAVKRQGREIAVTEADNQLMRKQQNDMLTEFVNFLATAPTANKGADTSDLQGVIAGAEGTLQGFNEFGGAQMVHFVNPMDIADYKAQAKVQPDATNTNGITLLQNFLGSGRMIVMNAIPAGTVYSTVVDNIDLAYLNMASDGNLFGEDGYTDETGLLYVNHEGTGVNWTYRTNVIGAYKLFTEIPEGVVKSTIGGAKSSSK